MGRKRIVWTPDMIGTLHTMRKQGYDYKACGEKIGVHHDVVARVAKELGLNQRHNRGTISGTQARRTEQDGHD